MNDEPGYIAKEISVQNAEGAAWFLLANCKHEKSRR